MSRTSPHVKTGKVCAELFELCHRPFERIRPLEVSAASILAPNFPPRPRTSLKGIERIIEVASESGTMVCLLGLFLAEASFARTRLAATPPLTVKPVLCLISCRMRNTTFAPASSKREDSVCMRELSKSA
eukprot:scaffold731_cov261-Pinguiococcus_pyrenoidosus.AAC.5